MEVAVPKKRDPACRGRVGHRPRDFVPPPQFPDQDASESPGQRSVVHHRRVIPSRRNRAPGVLVPGSLGDEGRSDSRPSVGITRQERRGDFREGNNRWGLPTFSKRCFKNSIHGSNTRWEAAQSWAIH